MNVELRGILKVIFDEQKINDNLSKKEIVVTVDHDTQYPQDIICQAINKKIELLEPLQVGQRVSVRCNLTGKAAKDNRYFNNLLVWDIKIM